MDRYQGQAAAWAAPLFSYLREASADDAKRTHKLPQTPCVLWLPDYGAYLRSLDLFQATFKTVLDAERAMRLGEDQAASVARDLIEITGVRVRLRPFHPTH